MNCPSCGASNAASQTQCSVCGYAIATTLPEGFLVDGRYQLLQCLGQGGMGTVYQAHDRTLDEKVALKVLRIDFAHDDDMARRFRSEIKLARRIRHPNVCAIHEYGEVGALRYIAMELIEGIDLKRRLTQSGGIPMMEAFEVAIQICHGLEAIHRTGIVHRDLKSANVMLDRFGQVRLMDFGIAKQLGAESSLLATGIGKIIGTPEYMSPEQARGEKIDTRSDLYALGIVIYEIFTGHVPFHGETPIATLFKNIEEPPPLTGPLAEAIPDALKPVLACLLAKAPAQRYSSAAQVAEALGSVRQACAAQPPPPPPPPTGTVTRPAEDVSIVETIATPIPARPTPVPAATPPVVAKPLVSPAKTPALPPAPPPRSTVASRKPPAGTRETAAAATPRQTTAILVAAILLVVAAGAIVTAALVLRNIMGKRPPTTTVSLPATVPSGPLSPLPASASPTATIHTPSPTPALAAASTAPTSVASAPPPTVAPPTPTAMATRSPTVPTPTPAPATPSPRPSSMATPVVTPKPTAPVGLAPTPRPIATTRPLDTAVPQPTPSPVVARSTATPGEPSLGAGTLQLYVKPWASVRIDGAFAGTTPFKPISLTPGVHVIELTHPAFKPLIRRVTVRPGVQTSLQIDLNEEAVKKPPEPAR